MLDHKIRQFYKGGSSFVINTPFGAPTINTQRLLCERYVEAGWKSATLTAKGKYSDDLTPREFQLILKL